MMVFYSLIPSKCLPWIVYCSLNPLFLLKVPSQWYYGVSVDYTSAKLGPRRVFLHVHLLDWRPVLKLLLREKGLILVIQFLKLCGELYISAHGSRWGTQARIAVLWHGRGWCGMERGYWSKSAWALLVRGITKDMVLLGWNWCYDW